MDVTELVQKQNPDFGRGALLEAFVSAHFNEMTRDLLGKESDFYRVLHLLGRRDINLGEIPNRIGKISLEEKQTIQKRFHELMRRAPKSNRAKHDKNTPAGPYLQRLTQTELMAIEAFRSSGDGVTNPAVATTLVQAHLEGWLPVVALPMDAKEILMQCMNQGDMQAAYLLGVKHYSSLRKDVDLKELMDSDEKPRYLVESDEERLSYLQVARERGNPGAIEWFEDEQTKEEMYESLREEQDASYVDWYEPDIKRALKYGPSSDGPKRFHFGVTLAEANEGHLRYSNKEMSDLSDYSSRHALAFQWIYEAAITNAEARYYIATSADNFFLHRVVFPLRPKHLDEIVGLINLDDVESNWKLIRSAAFPGGGIDPYYPAFIDLAEQALSRVGQSSPEADHTVTKFDEVLCLLVEGVDRIEKPDCKQALRIANLWESIDTAGHIERAMFYYSVAAKDSSFAAYKCAVFSLRSLIPGGDTTSIKNNFELARNAPLRYGEKLDEKACRYSEIALKIGWEVDSKPASWEEASMLLIRQVADGGYKPQMRNPWLLPSDVDLLLQHSPPYERYKQWTNEWRTILEEEFQRHEATASDESVQAKLDKMLRRIYLLYGTSEPSSILRFLSAMANDPDYLYSPLAMVGIDASSILIKFLFSHLTLLQLNGQGKALGEFKEVLSMAETMQSAPGGRGVTFVATSLQWLIKRSLDGINDAQPNCRRVSISTEMNGETTEFGGRFLNVILQNLENGVIPGGSVATEVIYTDRYVNTPFKVALLAKAIEAVVTHLKVLNRWREGMVNIYAGDLIEVSGSGSLNQSKAFCDAMERNAILKEILAKSNIEASLLWSKAPHGRAFIVRFSNASELRIDIDKGISFWKEARRNKFSNNVYDSSWTMDRKVGFLASNAFTIDTTETGCELFVEWHEGKDIN